MSILNSPILLLIICLALFALIYSVAKSVATRFYSKKRIQIIKETNSKSLKGPSPGPKIALTQTLHSFFQLIQKNNEELINEYKTLIRQCGWDPQKIFIYIFPINIICSIVMMLISILVIKIIDFSGPYAIYLDILIVIIFGMIGWKILSVFFNLIITSRYQRISMSVPVFIDILLICMRSGSSVNKAFDLFAQEFGRIYPDLAYELMVTNKELEILPDRMIAYKNLSNRVNIPIVALLARNFQLSEERGVPMVETIANVSSEIQKLNLLEIEKKMGKVPALLSVSIILFTLPITFLLILCPVIGGVMSSGSLNLVK